MIDGDELVERLRAYVAEETPALVGGAALLAVSGGADSVAVAALLCEAGIVRPERSVVAHFDHRLRSAAEAAADRAAAQAVAARYGFEFEAGAWDEPRAGEAAARDARYAFLSEVARRRGIGVIVTGHTSDDQAETVVMRTLRGAGLHGLRGIAPQRSRRTLMLVRPALCVSREETRAYCAANALAYHDDASNEDRAYLRNRVRLDLLPRMEATTPGARAALLRVAAEARAGVAALDAIAAAALEGATLDVSVSTMALSRAGLRAMPEVIVPYAWRLAIGRLVGDVREFERRHYVVMAKAAVAGTGTTLELPRGVRITVDADAVVLSMDALVEVAIGAEIERALPFEGVLGAWRIGAVRSGGASGIVLPAGALVRGWRAGDRIQPRGMQGHKKLQDYYVDRKIARRERGAAPVIACGGDVLWTPFGSAEPVVSGERFVIVAERASAIP